MKVLNLIFMLCSMLTLSLAVPEPSAILSPEKTTTKKTTTKVTTTKSKTTTKATKASTKTTTKTTSKTTSKTSSKTTTTSSASPTPTYLCSYESEKGLLLPKPGATYYWDDENGVTFEIFYCSAEYFKTSSKSGDVWFNNYGDPSANGQIVALQQTADNKDSDGGFSSYRFNVTVFPANGEAQIGPATVAFYEVINGYYVQYNYQIYYVNITIERKPSTSSSVPSAYPKATGIGQ